MTGTGGQLRKATHIAKEEQLTDSRYVRVPEAALDIQGPPYRWRHGVIPGMGPKPPALTFPIIPDPKEKDPKAVNIELADLKGPPC